jgi:CBS domain containing-hemolysin-like protein
MSIFYTLDLTTLSLAVATILIIEALFAGSEIALLSADKLQLAHQAKKGSKNAKAALHWAEHPEKVLATTLLITSISMIAVSTLISIYVVQHLGEHSEWLAILIASPLIVILGELLPKALFQSRAHLAAPYFFRVIQYGFFILYPLTRLISLYTSRLSRLIAPLAEKLGGKPRNRREEIKHLLSYGKRESEMKASEKKMIKRIFDFKDTEAKHALIPLVKVEAIHDSALISEALDRFRIHRHSRMPVYSGRIDNIIGVLDIADLFSVTETARTIQEYVSNVPYVPETQTLHDLLQDMSREDSEMVVVVDEYGGAVGILTFEDIVEEIVGEIQDETDVNQLAYKVLTPQSWLILAKTEIALINEELKLYVPEGEYETLGGFLLQQFGRIPRTGDELYLNTQAGSLKFTIKRANERKIESVAVEILD